MGRVGEPSGPAARPSWSPAMHKAIERRGHRPSPGMPAGAMLTVGVNRPAGSKVTMATLPRPRPC